MRYVLLAVILSLSVHVNAQLNGKYHFRHIDQSNGLIHSDVIGIGQDKKGFIWILSAGGLQRYDGARFLNYTEILNPATGRATSGLLFVDTSNNSICVTKGQILERLDLVTNKFITLNLHQVLNEDTLHPLLNFKDEKGSDHLISLKGSIRYEHQAENELGTWFNVNPGMKHSNTYIYQDSLSGEIWGHTYLDFFKADPKTKKIYSTSDVHLTDPMLMDISKGIPAPRSIHYFMVDSDDNLWISNWTQYLYRYNIITREFKSYSLQAMKTREGKEEYEDLTLVVDAMYEDKQKNIWVATDYAGLLLYNKEHDDFDFITSDEKISNGLRYNYIIHTIFQDRDDNIWLGTDRGISIFNPYRNNFQSIRHIEGTNRSIPKKDINDVCETAQGEILVATWGGGISIYDQQWNFIRNVKFTGDHRQNLVWRFIENDDGTIWAGTQAGYIHIYDPVLQTFNTIHPPETENSTIVSAAKDQHGNILLGFPSGRITIWNKADKKFYAYNDQADHVHVPLTNIWSLFVDRQNHAWAGTDRGLLEFNSETRSFEHFYHPGDSTADILIQGIEQYNDSVLIVGSMFGGIYFFNKNSHRFDRPFTDMQFNSPTVYALRIDEQKNLWLTTNYDIVKFDPQLLQKTQFNLGKYINTASFESRNFYALRDGRWVTSTLAELICFDPKQIGNTLAINNKVEISGCKILDRYINVDSVLGKKGPMILTYDQNFISIEFTALDFSNIRESNYSYRMTGVDKNWNYSTTKQFADYTDLKPGEYLFEVKVDHGQGPSPVTSFPILINSPWWNTLWFRTIYIVAIGSLIYLAFRKRIQTIRKESELKQRIAETEMMALRSQMNPHFIFNCLNSIDNLIQTNQKEKATTYLAKFARLIRAILENSKNNVIPCWKDLEALNLYLDMEALRWDHKINYQLEIDPQIQHGDYKVPPMIIQPFVENAIHHGLLNKSGIDKKLDIIVVLEGENIKYTITDNGVGRLKSAEYKKLNRSSQLSFGIQITKDRIALFNQNQNQSVKITDLYNGQQEPGGTKVEVWLTTQTQTI